MKVVGFYVCICLIRWMNKLYSGRNGTMENRNRKRIKDGLTLNAIFHHKYHEARAKNILTFVITKWVRNETLKNAIERETNKIIKI